MLIGCDISCTNLSSIVGALAGGAAAVISLVADDLDQAPPVYSFSSTEAGTLSWDFHSTSSDPGLGLGDIGSGSAAAASGSNSVELDLSAFEGETGYIHFRVVNGGGASNVLTSQEITVPISNLVANGTFDDATGWTLSSGWTIASGVLSCDGTNGANADYSIPSLVEGNQYRIQGDVTGPVVACGVRLGSAFQNLFNINSDDVTAGSFDETVTATAGTTLRFRCTSANGFQGTIDNLVVTAL